MMANSRNIGSAVASDLGPVGADAWHRWRIIIPRRSVADLLAGRPAYR